MSTITQYSQGREEIPEQIVTSLSEFVNYIEQIAKAWREAAKSRMQTGQLPGERFPGEIVPWFRGSTDAKYPLEPSLLRSEPPINKYNKDRTQIKQVEEYMLRRFRAAGRPFANISDESTIDWVFLMQHHGLPTRLLDWSKNALTALYFAIRKHKQREKEATNAAVWVLDPRRLNEACQLGRSIADPRDEQQNRIREYYSLAEADRDPSYPIPLIPMHVSPRLAVQHSRFTFHTDKRGGLKKFAEDASRIDCCWYLFKLIIPWSEQPQILRALRLVGITQPEITPGLDSLATEILQRMTLGVDDLELH
ncbi:MAG TPA: FRG domain-containing protein [Pyrinomonadaceae bacterium]|jgi:hypothetical protein